MQLTLVEAFAVVFVFLLFILMITGSIAICCKVIERKRQNQQHPASTQANANQLSGVNAENGQNNSPDAAAVKTSVKQRNNEQIILAPIIENEFDENKPQQIVTKQWSSTAAAAVTDDVNVEKIGGIVVVHTMPKTENIPPKKFGPIIKYHPLHPENDQTNLSPKIEHYPSSEGSSVSTAVFQHDNNKNVDNLQKTMEFESSILPNEMQSNMEKCSSVIQTSNNDANIRNEMEKKHQIEGNDQK
ncbi:hypothetical protein niasHS_016294 [Heterodera schachtii]|uniref:Uncharacterized protein n=1 Tax=Heterodera schachtii TaxID=97005 RepID=A0ABD2HUU8_HETSC